MSLSTCRWFFFSSLYLFNLYACVRVRSRWLHFFVDEEPGQYHKVIITFGLLSLVFLLLMLLSLWEYQRFSLRLFAYYPFGHYKPLIISVFVRCYWYLLTLKLTHTSNDAETIQRYLLLSHSVLVFNYPFSNGIHQMCASVFWTLLLLFSAFPNVERYMGDVWKLAMHSDREWKEESRHHSNFGIAVKNGIMKSRLVLNQ